MYLWTIYYVCFNHQFQTCCMSSSECDSNFLFWQLFSLDSNWSFMWVQSPLPTCKCSSPHGNANNKYYYMGILHHVMSFNFNHQRIAPLFFCRMNAYYTSQYCMTWNQNQNQVCGSERPQLYLIHHTLMSEKTKGVGIRTVL